MKRLPTAEQQRLDADFDRMFGSHVLPPIPSPLAPDQMAEGDLTAERC